VQHRCNTVQAKVSRNVPFLHQAGSAAEAGMPNSKEPGADANVLYFCPPAPEPKLDFRRMGHHPECCAATFAAVASLLEGLKPLIKTTPWRPIQTSGACNIGSILWEGVG